MLSQLIARNLDEKRDRVLIRVEPDEDRSQHNMPSYPMKADSSKTALLYQLEKRLLQPEIRQSAQALADLLASEFIEFGSSGRVFDQQQMIESLLSVAIAPPLQREIIEFNASVLAVGVVLVTYRVVTVSGEQSSESLRSSIWKSFGDRWKIVFHQGTLVTCTE